MARRTTKSPSRIKLRKAKEAAEKIESAKSKTASGAKKKVVKKATRKKAVKKKKKAEPQRMRLVWGVFDNSNQQNAVFPYTERKKADEKAAAMTEKGHGIYFVQPVKEPIPEKAEAED